MTYDLWFAAHPAAPLLILNTKFRTKQDDKNTNTEHICSCTCKNVKLTHFIWEERKLQSLIQENLHNEERDGNQCAVANQPWA
jgi:hypothetical protein